MSKQLAERIMETARAEGEYITELLRGLIRIPSPSCREEESINYIRAEMEKLELDEMFVDNIGNIVGRFGTGKRVILCDSHIDTVGVGNRDAWRFDPFEARMENGVIYGRGASDNKAGLACMVGALRILSLVGERGGFSLYVVGIVQEEDCEGLALSVLLEEHGISPECVVLGECTDMGVYRGHRGRAEIEIVTRGRSCHASAPERGDNALYRMAPVLDGIKYMNDNLKGDALLGKGTIAATKLECQTPSVNALPDLCRVYVDRRTIPDDTADSVTRELDEMVRAVRGEVSLLTYSRPSYRGYVKERLKFFPAWTLDGDSYAVRRAIDTCRMLFGHEPRTGCWTFSTDGNYSMGIKSIPTIGFGPGEERHAHSVDDQVRAEDLWRAAAFYALYPFAFAG